MLAMDDMPTLYALAGAGLILMYLLGCHVTSRLWRYKNEMTDLIGGRS
jgi:hypothetical protein